MRTREDVEDLVAELDDAQLAEVLDFVLWLTSEDENLPDAELAAIHHGEREIANGEYAQLEELSQTPGS